MYLGTGHVQDEIWVKQITKEENRHNITRLVRIWISQGMRTRLFFYQVLHQMYGVRMKERKKD